jgi:hypothetical protein
MTLTRLDFLLLLEKAISLDGGIWGEEEQGMNSDEGDYHAAERAAKEVGLPVTMEKDDPVVLAILEHRGQDGPPGENLPTMIIEIMIATERAWVHVCDQEVLATNKSRAKVALTKPVEELDFSARTYICIRGARIRTTEELILKSEKELLKSGTIGKRILQEIDQVLAASGLRLGMTPAEVRAIRLE